MDVLFMRQDIHGMLVSLLQMPFSCTFAACHESNLPRSQRSRHETIVSGNGFQWHMHTFATYLFWVTPDLWQSQKIHHLVEIGASMETSTNLFLGLVQVGDSSQTARFRGGQYNYHWVHHHFRSWLIMANLVRGFQKCRWCRCRYNTRLYYITQVCSIYCSIYCALFKTVNSFFYQKPPLMLDSWIISHHSSSLNNCSLAFCVSLCFPPLFAPESQDIETAGCIVS